MKPSFKKDVGRTRHNWLRRDHSVHVQAVREAWFAQILRNYYSKVPKILSVENGVVTMELVSWDGVTPASDLQEYLSVFPHKRDELYVKVEFILSSLEQSPIVHGDFQHTNLLVDHEENIWVVDFGMSDFKTSTSAGSDRLKWSLFCRGWKPLF